MLNLKEMRGVFEEQHLVDEYLTLSSLRVFLFVAAESVRVSIPRTYLPPMILDRLHLRYLRTDR